MSENEQKEIEETILPPYDLEKAPFSWDKLDGLLLFKASLISCSDFLGVHENTIKNHIKKRFGLTFTEYTEKKMSKTKVKLVQKAIEMAMSGNATMMIFSLKNICGWQDKIEVPADSSTPIRIEIVKDGPDKD
tara:strand:+ start:317 stop:715 length:399 start_codon:yes stop_codon:yes gene_type:complete